MTHNDILRRLRYTFELTDNEIINIYSAAAVSVSTTQLAAWLSRANEQHYVALSDADLAGFLNGFIIFKRGEREGATAPIETQLNNNIIFMKLRIALNLKAEDVIALLAMVDCSLTKHELSAFSRKLTNKHYRHCKDQLLALFLQALQQKYRPAA